LLTVFHSWLAVHGSETHYLLSGSADGSGKGEVTLLCT